MKTFSAKAETVKRDWYVVDADGKTLGRMARSHGACVASIKRNIPPMWTPATISWW